MKNLYTALLLALFLAFVSCQKGDGLLQKSIENEIDVNTAIGLYLDIGSLDFQKKLPDFLVTMGLNQAHIDNAKASLGRVIFYDKKLSADGKISCASCHKQFKGFADDVPFSPGVNGQQSTRNSMALTNVASFASHYTSINGIRPALLWDGRADDVIGQAPLAFSNPHEMGLSMPEVMEIAKKTPYYPYLMELAYGDPEVTAPRFLESLQEFVMAMGAASSKLDLALEKVNGDLFGTSVEMIPQVIITSYQGTVDTVGIDTLTIPLLNFNASELRGRNIFAANCTKCHSPIRTLQEVFVACNGLDMDYEDNGVGALTKRSADNGVFKSPALRNIGLTAPYMHDGRFSSLGEVVDFYSTGIQDHPNLHPLLRDANGQPLRMNLTTQEKIDLIAFMHTMTSFDVVHDQRFSNPFY